MNNLITNTKIISLIILMGFPLLLFAQRGTVSGTVSDANGTIIGASVSVKGTALGTTTNIDGKYKLSLKAGSHTLEVNYVGYQTLTTDVEITENGNTNADFTIVEGINITEVVILGSRASNRTNTNSPVPVDVIDVEKLNAIAPQVSLNQLLHTSAPSFSSNTQTISDGTDHIDPASLRGLGPDQVLVLINGKRRHSTSLINVNGTFGRGQVGTDLNAIPTAALKRIEVLRDGAAAQYGSDAIAGVINLNLNEDVNKLRLSVNTGANFSKNIGPFRDFDQNIDGESVDIGVNYGLPLGKEGGFINFTGAFNQRGFTSRMQEFEGQIFNGYNSVEWIASQTGADLSSLSMADVQTFAQSVTHFSADLKNNIMAASNLAEVQSLLDIDVTEAELTTRGQTRSDYNMRIGQSAARGGQFFANMAIPLGEDLKFYSFGGVGYRRGESGCFYRLPSQSRSYTPAYINGFLPKINSNIVDKSIAAGIKGKINDWSVDFSNVYGSNRFLFHMTETHNASMQNASSLEFDAGGHSFAQNTSNIDLSRYYEVDGINGINIAFGTEYRYENFKVIPGTEDSYGNYDHNLNLVNTTTPDSLMTTDFFGNARPSGAQCFAGFLPSNETDANRSSVAGYADAEFDITNEFLIATAIRFENYSDFGSTFNYKVAARYNVADMLTFRAAHSTGFRAPSLHQIHFSRTSTIFVTEGGVTTAQEVGVFSNNSRAARLLGIPDLEEETSQNFSAGVTAKLTDLGLTVTLDGYIVNIDNRIVLTGRFAAGNDAELQSIFSQAQADAAAFFANAINTQSRGLDLVVSHKILIGNNMQLTNDLAATFSKTERVGDINASPLLETKGLTSTYFNEESRIYLEEAVPRTKVTLSNSLVVDKFNVYLRNTYFGETTEATTNVDPLVNKTYAGKVITDLSLGYKVTPALSLTIGANNLFDIYPDEADPTFQSSGRFIYSRRSPQFSLNGRYLFARVAFTLGK